MSNTKDDSDKKKNASTVLSKRTTFACGKGYIGPRILSK